MINIKKTTFVVSFILILIVLVVSIILLNNFMKPQVSLDLSISPIEDEANFTELTLTLKSKKDVSDVSGDIILPEGLELVEGNLEWKTDLQKNIPKKINLKVKSKKEGEWTIKSSTKDDSVSAELVTKVEPSGEIYMTEEEFYKDKPRSYIAGLPGGSFVPEPLKGDALNSYFKSLNLTEDQIYVMMQFETLSGSPSSEQLDIITNDGIKLFETHGDHTYYAKIPRTILETKSYDFVRWIGIVEDARWRMDGGLAGIIYEKNCSGKIRFRVILYEAVDQIPDSQNKIELIANLSEEVIRVGSDIITVVVDLKNIQKIASLNFVKQIGISITPSICSPHFPDCGEDPFINTDCDI